MTFCTFLLVLFWKFPNMFPSNAFHRHCLWRQLKRNQIDFRLRKAVAYVYVDEWTQNLRHFKCNDINFKTCTYFPLLLLHNGGKLQYGERCQLLVTLEVGIGPRTFLIRLLKYDIGRQKMSYLRKQFFFVKMKLGTWCRKFFQDSWSHMSWVSVVATS